MELQKRKPTRLKEYDYSNSGYYFVTICTHDREHLLSHISDKTPVENQLTACGKIAEEQLIALENRYDGVEIDKYVIMPNHIHAIIIIRKETESIKNTPVLSDVICSFKSITVRLCRAAGIAGRIFQNSFHDHIIRGEKDYKEIWKYIDNNPLQWNYDRFFTSN